MLWCPLTATSGSFFGIGREPMGVYGDALFLCNVLFASLLCSGSISALRVQRGVRSHELKHVAKYRSGSRHVPPIWPV